MKKIFNAVTAVIMVMAIITLIIVLSLAVIYLPPLFVFISLIVFYILLVISAIIMSKKYNIKIHYIDKTNKYNDDDDYISKITTDPTYSCYAGNAYHDDPGF